MSLTSPATLEYEHEPIDRWDNEEDPNLININIRRARLDRIYQGNLVARNRKTRSRERLRERQIGTHPKPISTNDPTGPDTKTQTIPPTPHSLQSTPPETSAANTVLSTPELLEQILLPLPPDDLLPRTSLVSRTFRAVTLTSPKLTQTLFLRPTSKTDLSTTRRSIPIPFPFSLRPSPQTHLSFSPPTSSTCSATLVCGYAFARAADPVGAAVRTGLGKFLTQQPPRQVETGVGIEVRVQIYGNGGKGKGGAVRMFERVVQGEYPRGRAVGAGASGESCEDGSTGREGLRFADLFHEVTRAVVLLEIKRGEFVRRGSLILVLIKPDPVEDEEASRSNLERDKRVFRRRVEEMGDAERRRIVEKGRRGSI